MRVWQYRLEDRFYDTLGDAGNRQVTPQPYIGYRLGALE